MPRKSKIDRLFLGVFGWYPEADDIDRAICSHTGEPGHASCGICSCYKPRWTCIKHSLEYVNAKKV